MSLLSSIWRPFEGEERYVKPPQRLKHERQKIKDTSGERKEIVKG